MYVARGFEEEDESSLSRFGAALGAGAGAGLEA
jgi:hypothetical protein